MKPRQPIKRKKYLDPATVIIIKQVLLGLLTFAIVAALIATVWYTTRISRFTLETISVSGGITISEEAVKSRVEEKLAGAYLRIIPRRFAYFYPEQEIQSSVSQIERIKDVKVERLSGKEIKISFSEYIPDTLWCSQEDDSKCYFFDTTGYSFGVAPTLSGESVVRYYSSENKAEIGTRPFSQEDYEVTKLFIKQLGEIGWFVTKVEINSARDVFYTLSQGGELKVTLTEDPTTAFSNLEAILQSEEFNHLKPGNFKYLDLRFGTRVFVNEELDIVSSTSTPTSTEALVE